MSKESSYIVISNYSNIREDDIRNELHKELDKQKDETPEDIDKIMRVWKRI